MEIGSENDLCVVVSFLNRNTTASAQNSRYLVFKPFLRPTISYGFHGEKDFEIVWDSIECSKDKSTNQSKTNPMKLFPFTLMELKIEILRSTIQK